MKVSSFPARTRGIVKFHCLRSHAFRRTNAARLDQRLVNNLTNRVTAIA